MSEEIGCFDLLQDGDLFFDFDPSVVTESPLVDDLIRSSPDSIHSWIGEVESQLMNDEQQNFLELDEQSVSEFLTDLFVDYPTSDSGPVDLTTAKVSDVPTVEYPAAGKEPEGSNDSGKEKADFSVEKKSDASNDSGSENQDEAKVESENDGNDDAMAKKRRRYI
ncbi:unnamed protein product [Thlaspi arvense]|uniref:Uncharacterized protein n=1 Tax=Thlaspi arvense TaxID=13288 RepID=A0AAU9R8R7_THLAR|nr:unnamed protein product [Thlaspi arvense]